MLDKGVEIPGLSILLLKGLDQVEGEYLFRFYEAILTCLLCGAAACGDERIEPQVRARAISWHCQEGGYANFVENM